MVGLHSLVISVSARCTWSYELDYSQQLSLASSDPTLAVTLLGERMPSFTLQFETVIYAPMCMWVLVCVHLCTIVYMWLLEENLWESASCGSCWEEFDPTTSDFQKCKKTTWCLHPWALWEPHMELDTFLPDPPSHFPAFTNCTLLYQFLQQRIKNNV